MILLAIALAASVVANLALAVALDYAQAQRRALASRLGAVDTMRDHWRLLALDALHIRS